MTWATTPLPPAGRAPALRNSLVEHSDFTLKDETPDRVQLQPAEGAGATREYLTPFRLIDRSTVIKDSTWQPLQEHERHDLDTEHRAAAWVEIERRAALETPAGALSALSLALLVLPNNELVTFLESQTEGLFRAFPKASLWLVAVDSVLPARLSFLQIAFQLSVTPDLPLGDRDLPYQRSLQGQSLTGRINFAEMMAPVFLLFSPAATGIALSWAPHSLMLDFGDRIDLRQELPISTASLYEPQLLGLARDHPGVAFGEHLPAGDLASLLSWWVARLNVLYSHAADPTQFTNANGIHEPARQLGWWLSAERLIADLRLLGSTPQGSQLARLQTCFDLLDKAEVILGYGRENTGKGFERLLRRSTMLPLLDRAWENLPVRLRERFRAHGQLLFNRVYDEVAEHVLPHRRTPNAVKLGVKPPLMARALDTYVPELVRAVRNSSHGLIDQLTGPQLDLIATHDGDMPGALCDLAALIVIALIADLERVLAGTWWGHPTNIP